MNWHKIKVHNIVLDVKIDSEKFLCEKQAT